MRSVGAAAILVGGVVVVIAMMIGSVSAISFDRKLRNLNSRVKMSGTSGGTRTHTRYSKEDIAKGITIKSEAKKDYFYPDAEDGGVEDKERWKFPLTDECKTLVDHLADAVNFQYAPGPTPPPAPMLGVAVLAGTKNVVVTMSGSYGFPKEYVLLLLVSVLATITVSHLLSSDALLWWCGGVVQCISRKDRFRLCG